MRLIRKEFALLSHHETSSLKKKPQQDRNVLVLTCFLRAVLVVATVPAGPPVTFQVDIPIIPGGSHLEL